MNLVLAVFIIYNRYATIVPIYKKSVIYLKIGVFKQSMGESANFFMPILSSDSEKIQGKAEISRPGWRLLIFYAEMGCPKC